MTTVAREFELTYGSVAVDSIGAGTGVYVLEANQPQQWITVGTILRVYGATNAANNGTFTVTAVAGLSITTDNAASVGEAASPARIGFPVAGTSRRILDSQFVFTSDRDKIGIGFSFTIQRDLEADFVAEEIRVERAFKVPYQRFEMRQNLAQPLILDPLDSTGFNARPEIEKREEVAVNTGRSRRYHVRIEFDLPADLYVKSGRRNSAVTLTNTPNDRRTVILTGEWTATASQASARSAYNAGIDAFASDATAAFGGTYEKIGETIEESPDGTDKLLRFTRTYQEILSNQSSGLLDDTDIIDPTLEISRLAPAPGDSPVARRLGEIGVAFTAWVKKGVSPLSKYTNSLRSFLINKALSLFGASAGALVAETANEDPHQNKLIVNLQILAQIENVARINYRSTVETDRQTGVVLVPAWTGDPLSFYEFQGHEILLRVLTEEERVLAGAGGGGGGGSLLLGIGGAAGLGGGGQSGAFVTFPGGQTAGGSQIGGVSGAAQSALALLAQADFVGAAGAAASEDEVAAEKSVLLSDNTTKTKIRLGTAEHGLDVEDRTRKRVFQEFNPIKLAGAAVPTG